ncbi:hypothetical protein AC630_18310 [Bradyrhizobium sp. AS23.2]|nr:hypothetical protein AC630_18310 [Bradyrhizobium sp. AS23.2]
MSAQETGREIGYVESFDKKANVFVLHRGGQTLPIDALTPVRTGDRIEVLDATAKIVLRLVNRATPVTVSRGNLDTPLTDPPPAHPFWTPTIAWAASQIGKLDRDDREQVAASIRGSASGGAVPLLALAQTLPAGRQSLSIGWIGTAPAEIRLQGPDGKDVTSGQGTAGYWFSPMLDLAPGDFVIEVKIGATRVRQLVTVVPATSMPDISPDLKQDGLPEPLRELATAAWLAARDQRFILAAFQHVAPFARDSSPAKLLARSLVRGERPLPPG